MDRDREDIEFMQGFNKIVSKSHVSLEAAVRRHFERYHFDAAYYGVKFTVLVEVEWGGDVTKFSVEKTWSRLTED